MKPRRKWKWRVKKLMLFAALVFICLLYKYSWPLNIKLKNEHVTKIASCPACYGIDMCPQFIKETIVLTNWTSYTLLSYFFNAKNIFYARFKDQPVILKKLAHNHELEEVDWQLCNQDCDSVGRSVRMMVHMWANVEGVNPDTIAFQMFKTFVPENVETFACVKSQNLIDFLMKRTLTHQTSPENFLYISLVNPEPLIAMAFPESEGWPFPKYYGACGRFAVFENVGDENLSKMIYAPWIKRARIAPQILEMAFKFTDAEPIGLYLTDWSLDNFAINGRLQVKLVDLENIILVNRTEIKVIKAPGWNVEHHSVAFGCENSCFSYSIEDVCSHYTSDHNIFGACFGVISHLLKTIPSTVLSAHPLLPRLRDECTWPSHPGGRIEAAKQLMDLLKLI